MKKILFTVLLLATILLSGCIDQSSDANKEIGACLSKETDAEKYSCAKDLIIEGVVDESICDQTKEHHPFTITYCKNLIAKIKVEHCIRNKEYTEYEGECFAREIVKGEVSRNVCDLTLIRRYRNICEDEFEKNIILYSINRYKFQLLWLVIFILALAAGYFLLKKKYSSQKGQSALEYTMLIGGALIVATVVVILILTLGQQAAETTETALEQYITIIHEYQNCGNGVIDAGEDCSNCPDDVQCAAGESCVNGVCKPTETFTTEKHFGVDAAVLSKDFDVPSIMSELGDGISGYNGMCFWEGDEIKTNEAIQKLDLVYDSYMAVGRTLQVNLLNCDKESAVSGRIDTKFPENMDSYTTWVKDIINRYKGDIIYYQIDSEPNTGAFSGTKGQFVKMLDAAYDAAKEVDPNVQIMCCGWAIGDLFKGNPSDAEIEQLIADAGQESGFEFIRHVLENGKYDIATIHLGSGYDTIERTLEWFRRYTNKPIMFDDMTSAPTIGGTFHPEDTELREKYEIMDDPNHPLYEETTREMEAEQSRVTMKKSVAAFISGVKKVFLTWTADLPGYPLIVFRHCGIIHTYDKRIKPVFYTYKILISKLDGFESAVKLDDYTYKFTFEGKGPVYVLWSDSGTRTVDLSPYVSTLNVEVTRIITKQGDTDTDAIIEHEVSAYEVLIDETPIFVEEAGE